MLEEHVEQLYKRCLNIIGRYPDVFPILRIISNSYRTEEQKPLAIYTFETRTGFKYIFNDYINKAKSLRPFINLNDLENFDKTIIKNILYEFTEPYALKEDLDNWKKLLKKENLN